MVDRPTISFAQAQAAMAAMIEKAAQTPELPVSMAIVDAAGNLLAFATMDNLRLFTPRHAIRKAYTAAITGLNSTVHAEWLKTRGLTVGDFGGDPMLTPSGGGIVVRPSHLGTARPVALGPSDSDFHQNVMGGIGVGGYSKTEWDEELALIGLKAMDV